MQQESKDRYAQRVINIYINNITIWMQSAKRNNKHSSLYLKEGIKPKFFSKTQIKKSDVCLLNR